MLCVVVGVHGALRIETAVEFATYLLLDVKSHVKKILSTHISLQSMTASLKTDFSLSLAIVALVLGVATAEERAVVVERETVGAVESEILTTYPIRAHLPTSRKIRVADLDDVVAVRLAGHVLHQASLWR